MAININPNRINTRTGAASNKQRQLTDQTANEPVYKAPRRSEVNFIPSPESLRTLISGAISALRQGVYWDRGTILNLLV